MSGLVKGVKKVFKAIGNAVKKVMKTTIGKILVGALAIFTGGAALAAFGAMGAGATFGSVMSAAVAGGAAPFSAAFSALTGAASSVGSALGLTGGTAGATTAAVTEGVVAAGGTAAAEGGALAAAAAEAAAPGAAAWAAPAAETAGLFGTEAATAAGGMGVEAGSVANGFVPEAASQGAAQGANLADMAAAPQGTSGSWMQNVGTSGAKAADITGGMLQTPNITGAAPSASGGNWLTNLWDFVKPETAASRLMYGQIISGVGNSVMQGRAQQAQQDYQARMTAVPDISKTFEKKPDFRWALAGGK